MVAIVNLDTGLRIAIVTDKYFAISHHLSKKVKVDNTERWNYDHPELVVRRFDFPSKSRLFGSG